MSSVAAGADVSAEWGMGAGTEVWHLPQVREVTGVRGHVGDGWDKVDVSIRQGAAGARAVWIALVAIGAWATVAAGAVVTKDMPVFALVAGVPARGIGWLAGPATR